MKNNQYNIGLVSISFRNHTPREILFAMKDAGLEYIEWGSDIHAPPSNSDRLRDIASLQAEYGIKCSSYGTYFRLGEMPVDTLQKYIDAAKILGTDILRLWCGTSSGKSMSDEQKAHLIAQCRKAADIAEQNGVTLCMECHQNTFTENPLDTVYLMKEVNSPRFLMYWQPFQWLDASENIQIAQKLSPYVKHIHVFNWKGTKRLPLRDGIAEWSDYLANFHAPHTLLLEFMPDDKLETLTTEANALKTIIEGLTA